MERMPHGHRHRSRDYEWNDEDADRFLQEAAFEAEVRYPPIALQVARVLDGEGGEPVVLDLGCGPALLLPELYREVPRARMVGLDPSRDMLGLATRVLEGIPPDRYHLIEGRAEDIPLRDGSVDVVVALKNLHEWEDAPRGMSEVARVLGAGGSLVLRDSNRAYPYWRLRALVAWRRVTRGGLATRGYLGPYRDAYRPEEVDRLLADAGMTVVEADRRSWEYFYLARRP